MTRKISESFNQVQKGILIRITRKLIDYWEVPRLLEDVWIVEKLANSQTPDWLSEHVLIIGANINYYEVLGPSEAILIIGYLDYWDNSQLLLGILRIIRSPDY